jgi:CheY-like chemotaxis protein
MVRVPSVAKTEQTARPLATKDVGKLAVTGRSCGNCGSIEIRPSNRRNAMDILLACVLLVPFRCRACRKRFYRVWRRGLEHSPDPPIAPVLVMPARRKVPKVDAISPRRIELEPVPSQRNQTVLIPPGPELIPAGMNADVIRSAPSASAPIDRPAAELELPEEKPAEVRASPPQPLLAAIPGAAAPSAAARGPAALGAAAPGAAALGAILILESDLSIRKLLRRLLERRGYFIMEIEQADHLASRLRNRRADLLIVDVSPTGEPSVKALVALAPAHPGLKILALSAESLARAEHDGEIPGCLSVLPKPFPLDSFVDCVDRLLGRSNPPNAPL